MTNVMHIEPLKDRLEAFGARALRVDGHNVEELAKAGEYVPDGRPLFILAYTNPARGLTLLDKRRPNLHYLRFKSEDERNEYQACFEEMKGKTPWKS
jgi:transketolase